MGDPFWPVFDLRIRTPRIELRPVAEAEMYALTELADRGIHDPARMPFQEGWTDLAPPQRQRSAFQFYWRSWAQWSPQKWVLNLAVSADGEVIGNQSISATDFPTRRVVETGSWIGMAHQGLGYGKEMRAAVLHFAFEGLSAVAAETSAFWDNGASLGVTRALGYESNGSVLSVRRGEADRLLRFWLNRARWQEQRRDDITLDGLDTALPQFGL